MPRTTRAGFSSEIVFLKFVRPQALGTGIASELDLAYWHARYTAASRFDAGSVTAETTSRSSHVVPPPEVYFVGLAFHVPSVAELGTLPQLGSNPAFRRMLAQDFDLPFEAAAGDSSIRHSKGVCVFALCFYLLWFSSTLIEVAAWSAVRRDARRDNRETPRVRWSPNGGGGAEWAFAL